MPHMFVSAAYNIFHLFCKFHVHFCRNLDCLKRLLTSIFLCMLKNSVKNETLQNFTGRQRPLSYTFSFHLYFFFRWPLTIAQLFKSDTQNSFKMKNGLAHRCRTCSQFVSRSCPCATKLLQINDHRQKSITSENKYMQMKKKKQILFLKMHNCHSFEVYHLTLPSIKRNISVFFKLNALIYLRSCETAAHIFSILTFILPFLTFFTFLSFLFHVMCSEEVVWMTF